MELSQLTYAHFIVLRIFKEIKGADEQKRVAKAFRGQAVRLATHAISARVIQSALDSLPVASAALIKVTSGCSFPGSLACTRVKRSELSHFEGVFERNGDADVL